MDSVDKLSSYFVLKYKKVVYVSGGPLIRKGKVLKWEYLGGRPNMKINLKLKGHICVFCFSILENALTTQKWNQYLASLHT